MGSAKVSFAHAAVGQENQPATTNCPTAEPQPIRALGRPHRCIVYPYVAMWGNRVRKELKLLSSLWPTSGADNATQIELRPSSWNERSSSSATTHGGLDASGGVVVFTEAAACVFDMYKAAARTALPSRIHQLGLEHPVFPY